MPYQARASLGLSGSAASKGKRRASRDREKASATDSDWAWEIKLCLKFFNINCFLDMLKGFFDGIRDKNMIKFLSGDQVVFD